MYAWNQLVNFVGSIFFAVLVVIVAGLGAALAVAAAGHYLGSTPAFAVIAVIAIVLTILTSWSNSAIVIFVRAFVITVMIIGGWWVWHNLPSLPTRDWKGDALADTNTRRGPPAPSSRDRYIIADSDEHPLDVARRAYRSYEGDRRKSKYYDEPRDRPKLRIREQPIRVRIVSPGYAYRPAYASGGFRRYCPRRRMY